MAAFPRPFRFTTEEYEQMGAAGILGEDDRVELIAGEIIEMAAVGVRHANGVRAWIRLLRDLVPHGMLIDVQNPIKVRMECSIRTGIAIFSGGTS